jgi:hypothetical protein
MKQVFIVLHFIVLIQINNNMIFKFTSNLNVIFLKKYANNYIIII